MRRAALLLSALVLAGCGGGDEPSVQAVDVTAPGGIENLDNVLQLRSNFESDAGKTRVILLFSPT